MREQRKDRERLEHILAAIDRILRYTNGKTYNELVSNDMMYYAVVKNIEIMGEAANMLTPEFTEAHPETPWKQIRGMRNYIVHEYFQIDDVVVWDVISNNLPTLRKQIEKHIMDTDWQQWEKGSMTTG